MYSDIPELYIEQIAIVDWYAHKTKFQHIITSDPNKQYIGTIY